MRIFKISKHIEIVCISESTRSGFRHLATLFLNGIESVKSKCCYQNRTWEKYEFQSVLKAVVNKASLSDTDKKLCDDFIEGDHTDWSQFKSTSAIASLGELFCDNKKDKNDWKLRMLKAGLGNQGLMIPKDWDTLTEEEKEKRLNAVINVAGGKV